MVSTGSRMCAVRRGAPGRHTGKCMGCVAHLLANVVQGVGGVDSEADQDDVGVGV